MLAQFMTQFHVILLNDLSFPCGNDVIRPRPLRPSPWCDMPSSHVRRRKKSLWGRFLYGVYRPGNGFELIPTVKMETRHAVEGYFGNEFPSICIHLELWQPEVARRWTKSFLLFWKERTLTGKIFRDTDRCVVFKFRGIRPRESR